MKIETMYNAASYVEGANIELEEVLLALQLLDEAMESKGMIPDDKRETWKAVNFMDRFPVFFSTYRVLCRELARISKDLQESIDEMYKAARAQNGGAE